MEAEQVATEPAAETLVKEFPKLFSDKLGCIEGVEVKLELKDGAIPVRQPLRTTAYHYRTAVKKELDSQVDHDVLEKVEVGDTVEWVSNLVIIPKDRKKINAKCGSSRPMQDIYEKVPGRSPTGPARYRLIEPEAAFDLEVRLTCDSRDLNSNLKRTRFVMKTMDELIAAVNGAVMFSKLDLRKAFHQVKIAAESQHLTTIATPFGMYRYKRLHMGITSASEIFTEIIRKMLEDLPGCVNMTDDILVFGRTPVEHHANLRRVLKRLEERGVTLNVEKSQFCKTELTFYGHRQGRFANRGPCPSRPRNTQPGERCRAQQLLERPELELTLLARRLHRIRAIVAIGARRKKVGVGRSGASCLRQAQRLDHHSMPWLLQPEMGDNSSGGRESSRSRRSAKPVQSTGPTRAPHCRVRVQTPHRR